MKIIWRNTDTDSFKLIRIQLIFYLQQNMTIFLKINYHNIFANDYVFCIFSKYQHITRNNKIAYILQPLVGTFYHLPAAKMKRNTSQGYLCLSGYTKLTDYLFNSNQSNSQLYLHITIFNMRLMASYILIGENMDPLFSFVVFTFQQSLHSKSTQLH